jgi:hypothetical protein
MHRRPSTQEGALTGIPIKTVPATSVSTFCAKNGMKIKAIIAIKDPIIVKRYPYRSATMPLMSKPRISPTRAPFERPLCHGAVTWYFPGSYSTPNFLLKGGKAKNEEISTVSVTNVNQGQPVHTEAC